MVEILLYAIFCFFSAYGLVMALKSFFGLPGRHSFDSKGMCLVLLVKNREKDIEGIVRGFFEGSCSQGLSLRNQLMVIDLGSEDETVDILERLENVYEGLQVVRESGNRYKSLGSILQGQML